MTTAESDHPGPREILDAVQHSQDVLTNALGRIELDLGSVKSDVAALKADMSVLKSDVASIKDDIYRLERRIIRTDDRLYVIENLNPGPILADHERRIARLEVL